MQKKFFKLEIAGIFFVTAISVFLQNLYDLCGCTLLGVMFGCVNDSIWETEKTLLLPYIIWSIIEILCLRVPFKKFVVSKVISLWSFSAVYALLCLLFSLTKPENYTLPEFAAALVCIVLSFFISYRLTFSDKKLEALFVPSLFMLLLFIALYCSFTPFPPNLYLFMDRATGLYGIIPDNFDTGAVYLDSVFGV